MPDRVKLTEQQALKKLIAAWDVLPGGYHSQSTIERWLVHKMKPAIDAGRALLASSGKGD